MSRKFITLVVIVVALFGLVAVFRTSGFGAGILWKISNGGTWLFPLIVVSSLIDSINPCAFSILVLTIAFLFSLGRIRSDILKIGASYIVGIFLIYLLIGLGILQTLHLFNTPHFMAKVGASLLILWGLLGLINHFFPAFPIKLHIPKGAHSKMAQLMENSSLPAAFLLGGLVGLCEFPCTGGPYLMALGLLHDKTTFLTGFGYLLLYNVIFVLPLVLILFIASEQRLLEKVQAWKKQETGAMRLWGGLAMIVLGRLIFVL